jgi:hypothetical protein
MALERHARRNPLLLFSVMQLHLAICVTRLQALHVEIRERRRSVEDRDDEVLREERAEAIGGAPCVGECDRGGWRRRGNRSARAARECDREKEREPDRRAARSEHRHPMLRLVFGVKR